MPRGTSLITLSLLLLPLAGAAQMESSGGGEAWFPPPGHREAVARARLDLTLLDGALAGNPLDRGLRLQRLRTLYFLGVDEESYLDPAWAQAESLLAGIGDAGLGFVATLDAYAGAIQVLRGKHAFWPPTRSRYLRDGLGRLDRVLESHPRHPEARYLRLVSTWYLPFFFGRRDSAREDAAALALLLPEALDDFPPATFAGIADFLLGTRTLDEPGRIRVEEARARAMEGIPQDPLAALLPPRRLRGGAPGNSR